MNHVGGLVSMNQKLLAVYRTGSQRAGGRVVGLKELYVVMICRKNVVHEAPL